jgi:pimeloyl-ACP methyl ester carboxylesterase
MTSSHYVHYQKSRLHYIKAGTGKERLLFFHGFGQDHSVYIPIIQALSSHFTLFIFDLYFHGKSVWGYDERPLEKEHWTNTLQQFLTENLIEKFSVTGFSLGGKFALASAEAFPDRCQQILLIAPDGIKTNFWYSLATYPFAFRKLFKSFIENHERFLSILKFVDKHNLIDKGLIRFADYQMNAQQKRERVYYSWIVFRHLAFKNHRLAKIINDHHIKTTIVVGRYDNVIRPADISSFAKKIKGIQFDIVEAGHTGLLTREIFRRYFVTQN